MSTRQGTKHFEIFLDELCQPHNVTDSCMVLLKRLKRGRITILHRLQGKYMVSMELRQSGQGEKCPAQAV